MWVERSKQGGPQGGLPKHPGRAVARTPRVTQVSAGIGECVYLIKKYFFLKRFTFSI